MRLSRKFLQKRCKEKLHLTKFLDVSGVGLVTLDHVDACPSLNWLIASDNKLQADDGLENQRHLWYLDLGNNQISLLGCLSRYLALGTLILSNNNLKWVDLEKIRHAHIMCISLHGNPCLDTDPYYRIHVIDCLPLIWELDGRLVTVTERLHVKQFFIDTELSQHPVRHKMGKSFRTSAIKNIGTEGIVSKQCKYIYSKFPMSETHTKHTDERRLVYLTHMVQQDILQWSEQLDRGDRKRPVVADGFLDNLLEQRHNDPERCNMVMLLLVISLEFQLPTALMRSVLSVSNLDTIGSVYTMPLFLLPAKHRTRVICVLLNAAKLQRDNNMHNTGGLYPQLFMCLYYTVAQLTRISQTSDANMYKVKQIPLNSDYRALMAGEVVSLMLNVPRFFTYVTSDSGVISLLECATGSSEVVTKSQEFINEAEDIFSMMSVRAAHRKMKTLVTNAILDRLNTINVSMSDIPIGDRYLSLSDSLPIKPLHSVIWASEFLTNGLCVPRLAPPILYPAREAQKPRALQPKLGDKVLLGPQVIGELLMILEGDISLVKIPAVTLPNGSVASRLKYTEAHYTYVDLQALCFARDIGMWRPIKTQGDKHTIHSVEPNELLAITQKEALFSQTEKTQPEIRSPLTNTLMVYAPNAQRVKQRPQSAVVVGQKAPTSDRRTVSARLPDTNTNFAASQFCPQDDEHHGKDLNQNVTSENDVAATSDEALQSDTEIHTTDVINQDDLPGLRDTTFVANMPERQMSPEYVAPLPSRSSSPVARSLVSAKCLNVAWQL
ncbi:hypothetical protein BsWGS_19519 [Bradybaena similaris]